MYFMYVCMYICTRKGREGKAEKQTGSLVCFIYAMLTTLYVSDLRTKTSGGKENEPRGISVFILSGGVGGRTRERKTAMLTGVH